MLRIWLLSSMLFFCQGVLAEKYIANGKIIAESVFPEVVKIYSTYGSQGAACTATIVGHNSLLTAAHCLDFFGPKAEAVEIVKGKYEGVVSVDCFLHPEFGSGTGFHDIALVKFPNNSFKDIFPIAATEPVPGQKFTIVGYGKFNFYASTTDGHKRMGTNTLDSVGRRFDFSGHHKNQGNNGQGTGQDVANLPGDSGGPMLVNKRVIGVSSSIDATLDSQSNVIGHYENVLFTDNLEFLRESALKESLHLAGLQNLDLR